MTKIDTPNLQTFFFERMSLESRADALLRDRGLDFYESVNAWGDRGSCKCLSVDLRTAFKTIKNMTEDLDFHTDGSDVDQLTKGFYFTDYLARLAHSLKEEYTKIDRSLKLWKKHEKKLFALSGRIKSYEIVHEIFMETAAKLEKSSLLKAMKVEQIAMKKARKELEEQDVVNFDDFLQQMKNDSFQQI